MHARTAFALSLALTSFASLAAPTRAWADEKEACLTAADQGQSQRDDGQYMAARDQFLTCAREVCPKIVHDQCTEWLRQLDEAMPTVVFGARDPHGNDLTSARVLSDGKLITTTLDGKPIPLDPGPHDIRFERDSSESVTVHVVLRTGEKNREVSATFPAAEGTPVGATLPGGRGGGPGEQPATNAPFWGGRAITSLSLLVGAAAAVGVGAYFGVQSHNEKSTADGIVAGLPGNGACHRPTDALASDCSALNGARDRQNTDALLNEVLYVGGGVLAAGALATWLLWPKPSAEASPASASRISPMVGPTQAGIRVEGAF